MEDRPAPPPADIHPAPAAAQPSPAPPAPARGFTGREVLFGTVALAGAGIATLALLSLRAAPASGAATAETSATTATTVAADAAPATATRSWSSANASLWLGQRRKGVAFDLAAENTVAVWMRTVRPTLVVRCAAGTVHAFVVTESAAQLESQTDDHTVTFSFDGQPETRERWPDSAEHDALFAPDGSLFARRIAQARELRFGFTPHNAAPVVVRFHVAGLRPLFEPAKDCK